ncbi:MAG: enoyl-CoA hydratase-related protein [Pseudomonadota bacterium]
MTQNIYFDAAPPLGEIVLNAPEKRNALSVAMWTAIPGLIEAANRSDQIKVILIHGGDAGAFAAGVDISEFETLYATPESTKASTEQTDRALAAIEQSQKPVIAAIDGPCFGAGLALALAADIRIASLGAKFGIPPVKLGVLFPPADLLRLLRTVGPGLTKELIFTARVFGAEEAKDIRLVDRVTQEAGAISAARTMATDIAAQSQWSVRANKEMIRGLQSGWRPDGEAAQDLFLRGFQGDDFKEGYTAFLEKRPAKFPSV